MKKRIARTLVTKPSLRTVLLALVVLSIALVAGAYGARSASSDAGPSVEDLYYGVDGKIGLSIPLDEIGVITRPGVSREALGPFLESEGLTIDQEYPGIFILRLQAPASRAEIVDLARKVVLEQKRLFRDAGLVAREPQAEVPMVVTDEFIVGFDRGVGRDEIDKLNAQYGVEVVRPDRYVENQFLVSVTPSSPGDALEIANRYRESGLTSLSHPNFWIPQTLYFTPNDPLFPSQWHHENSGAASCLVFGMTSFCAGTPDADADTPKAWDLTLGSSSTVIAVMDNGTDFAHEDLEPNHQLNAGEIPGNMIDDDGNGFVDDVDGWDFVSGDNDPTGGNHGTAVAGVAAARGDNSLGVAGACPDCSFIPIVVCCGASTMDIADAFGYATDRGARVMTNSWGYTSPAASVPPAIVTAINNAAAASPSRIILFAGGNDTSSAYCGAAFPSLENVIAVQGSSNLDREVKGYSFGNCMDIMAPTRFDIDDPSVPQADPTWVTQFTGTQGIATTDQVGMAGYNPPNPMSLCPVLGIANFMDTSYTNCFGGTSSATPLTAGAAGLLLSANPGLSRLEAQRLLQDTADKTEDSLGAYDTGTGFSSPVSGIATHSWGRLNAFEAVRVAAPAPGGRGGVDVFLRDNRLDWGNTEQPSNYLFEPVRGYIGHWKSVDIKIDAPPYQAAPTTNDQFEALMDEAPKQGLLNHVYLRVRNRGPVTAESVTAKIHWTQFGTALPALPADFWSAFPADSVDTTEWHPIGTQTLANLEYSGASVAGCPGRPQPSCGGSSDAAQIAAFDWVAPTPDPMKPNHFCLLAIVDSPQDPVGETSNFVVDSVTPTNNNVTHRNIAIDTTMGSGVDERFWVRNPTKRPLYAILRVRGPRGWKITLDRLPVNRPFFLAAGQQVLVTATVSLPAPGLAGDVEIVQERYLGQEASRPMGGLVLELRP